MKVINHMANSSLCKNLYALIVTTLLFVATISVSGQSVIYGGGPIYKNRSYSINELKNSGYTTVVVWTIHIDASGNFNFNGEFPLCTNGSYVGNSSYPNFAGDMTALKSGNTSVNRIEFCLSAWGSGTFTNIKNLINAQGTGSTTTLYKNFQAIRNTFPAVDAIVFDDESTYDVSTSTQLAVMLGNLGFKVTLVPYTAQSYWTNVANNTNSQRPGTVDRVDLQCYAGGAGNNPCNWNFGSIPVYPGLWSQEKTTSQVQSQLTTWKNNCASKGGFIWLYDDIDNSSATAQYASAIRNVFGGGNVSNRVAMVHKDCNYTGSIIGLPLGDYTLSQLISRGILNDDISSIQVSSGYQVVLYEHDNFTGTALTLTSSSSCLVGAGWNDRVSSMRVQSTSLSFSQTIQAENYSTMLGVQTETTTDAGGGTNVGWIDNSDWMAYNNISIPSSGNYLVEYRVASPNTTGVLSLDLNAGAIQLGTVSIPNTGGWQNWATVSHTVALSAGTYNVGVFASTGGWNFNWIRITQASGARVAVPSEAIAIETGPTSSAFPNPFTSTTKISVSLPASGNTNVVVMDNTGRIVRTVFNAFAEIGRHEFEVNVENLPSGFYVYAIKQNGFVTSGKMLKQ
ncbi:carbohydrate-binding protein [Pseudochryseolinea flava]|uniref:Carbohydrate-binding protein n=1 Tax=Pseudochryseolinea flava TaxID=2059302 RepID=A0A364Y7U1_9BACT|nr:carbohydrate-binding protein [Pseudochryseolinea flava]RAW01884.1 hypothetical protein DQQ10_09595 [Pseudochryseolinea flava]